MQTQKSTSLYQLWMRSHVLWILKQITLLSSRFKDYTHQYTVTYYKFVYTCTIKHASGQHRRKHWKRNEYTFAKMHTNIFAKYFITSIDFAQCFRKETITRTFNVKKNWFSVMIKNDQHKYLTVLLLSIMYVLLTFVLCSPTTVDTVELLKIVRATARDPSTQRKLSSRDILSSLEFECSTRTLTLSQWS